MSIKYEIQVYNTLTDKKEKFEPLNSPFVGMYVCGPTVYSDVHLGNCRTFTSFDVIYRYLLFLGYKVRYIRNITDVGHLVDDADAGEDKIAKKAKLENLEPMEVVQRYTNGFHDVMKQLNNLTPSIEPTATGHIIEQIAMVKSLITKGLAYETNGSVYFDVLKYNEIKGDYGKLSGRVLEDLYANTRDLDGQNEKRNSLDFALWKKAMPEHIMRWTSPWGDGFPGWHIECSVMSSKYLGEQFDIHCGGMDLKFPHHECEIAQSTATFDKSPVKYWFHTNMLTINGARMGKSKGNSILPAELFSGNHTLLTRPYSPMVLRFMMLQTHYRSTMDLSNEALLASAKGYNKLLNTSIILQKLTQSELGILNEKLDLEINSFIEKAFEGLNDDFNTGITISHLFNVSKSINAFYNRQADVNTISKQTFDNLKTNYELLFTTILGLKNESDLAFSGLATDILQIYKMAKDEKQYDKVDVIRTMFKSRGLVIKDMKTGVDWGFEE
ncbi:MAG: cysteine--tRNA ligase [Cytophagales bacterium]|nr:MAG: cysteine--tRNA ligase [Cytophagales bacterium]